jgi:hypothetical protein
MGYMDDISFKILKILQEKARVPNIEVARRVGMAPSGVLERVRREKIAALPQVRSTRTTIALNTYKESARIPLDDSVIQKLKKRRT